MTHEFVRECHESSVPASVAELDLAEMLMSEVRLIDMRIHSRDAFRGAKAIDFMKMIAECRIFTSLCGDYKS